MTLKDQGNSGGLKFKNQKNKYNWWGDGLWI